LESYLQNLDKRIDHLNEAYSHYLKSYEILNEISEKKLVDNKEFGLMKARTCLNCGELNDSPREDRIKNKSNYKHLENLSLNVYFPFRSVCYG
jgi:hypothetical protein